MFTKTTSTEVLIAGAGPTGLTLALWLTKLGVECRIVDKTAAPGETSRALAVQARTLEFHRQIGIADAVINEGVMIEQITLRARHRVAATPKLSKFGEGLSKYPFAFALPQDVHERALIKELAKLGVEVERQTELLSFEQTNGGVTAFLRKDGVREVVRASYLAGCDGAHSVVRHGLKIGFPGGVYDQSFYVADVVGEGDITKNGMDVNIDAYGFGIVMPVRQTGSVRVIGVVPKEHESDPTITFDAIRKHIEADNGVRIRAVNWFSTYRVHHRVADKFRVGRVFLAGDAGHIHSPAGGQGMNTGIGDAVNLAWKIAAVLQGRVDEKVLDSYEPERIAFARMLIASTDRAFKLITGRSLVSRIWRHYVMPRVVRAVSNGKRGSRALFDLVSQIRVNYRDSAISFGYAGKVRGGDRLPYFADASGDNHAWLGSLDWQIHIYGDVAPAFRIILDPTGIEMRTFAWTSEAKAAGLVRNAAYLVRPDGYIALAMPVQDASTFVRYIDEHAIKPRLPARRVKLALAS